VGAYRDENGQPWVLPVVRKVEQMLANDTTLNKEYLPIDGFPDFRRETAKLLFGPTVSNKIATVQTLSGTGGVRLGAEFLKKVFPPGTTALIPNPTWGVHKQIFEGAGMLVKDYRYFDKKTNGLDFEGMTADIRAAPERSVVILHACAHNPTGVDPTLEQWGAIADLIKEKNHLTYFDCAYQGFASGDIDHDAAAVRLFVSKGHLLLAAQSYAKNFGLYSERAGALNVVCATPQEAEAVSSQLKTIIRPMYSNPPSHGAFIVAKVLSDPALFGEWTQQVKQMADRIKTMRQLLFDALVQRGTPGKWNHILEQIGMFTFSGLTPAQSQKMIDKHHVYMLVNGRISMPGLTAKTVPYLADAIHDVVTNP
jgi:aspartate aminotransferase